MLIKKYQIIIFKNLRLFKGTRKSVPFLKIKFKNKLKSVEI